MSYIRAEDILPKEVLELVQRYADGQTLYIPRKLDCHKAWGTETGTRKALSERNRRMYEAYRGGAAISELSERFFLTEKSVRRILRNYREPSKSSSPDAVTATQNVGRNQN